MTKLKDIKLKQTEGLNVTLQDIIVEDNAFECSLYVDGEYAFEIYNMDLCGSHSYDVINHKLWHKVLDFIEEKENTDQSIKILDKIINNELGLV
tara:strand:- start:5139 stop:5420 length:282 start_codon:yes stop_codon:yes gene_type:complete